MSGFCRVLCGAFVLAGFDSHRRTVSSLVQRSPTSRTGFSRARNQQRINPQANGSNRGRKDACREERLGLGLDGACRSRCEEEQIPQIGQAATEYETTHRKALEHLLQWCRKCGSEEDDPCGIHGLPRHDAVYDRHTTYGAMSRSKFVDEF